MTDPFPATLPGVPAPVVAGYARRGDRVLENEEFERHLAQAVRLENVGIMLGAGASLGCGGMSMAGLWQDFEESNAPKVAELRAWGFLRVPPGQTPNVETLLDELTVACLDAERRGHVNAVGVPSSAQLDDLRVSLLRAVLKASLLDRDWLCDPSQAAASDALSDHVKILTRLVHTRQPGQPAPWVFTTNYDMAVELAAENAALSVRDGFSGFHNRTFTPSSFDLGLRNTESRGEAQFGTYEVYLAKLHGSLSWESTSDGNVRAVQIAAACDRLFAFAEGTSSEPPGVLIYPSSAKFVDTVGFVYGEMIRRFTHYLSRPNVSLIVSGYGFGDFHLNRVLLSALNNPTLQLIVYLPEIAGFDNAGNAVNATDLREGVNRILDLRLPQITVIGGGDKAYLSALAQHLPDPTVLDDPAARGRVLAKALADQLTSPQPMTS